MLPHNQQLMHNPHSHNIHRNNKLRLKRHVVLNVVVVTTEAYKVQPLVVMSAVIHYANQAVD
jgi:hypothetical protein